MEIKYLTRLRLGLSHLNGHKFRHNFQDCLNPLCPCSLEDPLRYCKKDYQYKCIKS